MRWLVGVVLFLLALGTLRTVGCGDESPCGDCNDGNPCTEDGCTYRTGGELSCDPPEPEPEDYFCYHSPRPIGTPCGSGNVCVKGVCRENLCAACVDDGNECTTHCDYETGACNEPLRGDGCRGEANDGRCYGGVCIVCEELDCDDGDLCTTDDCHYSLGCVHEPVSCWDGDRCATCDPETGECNDALAEGHWCFANRELGIDGEYLLGLCESGRCTVQTCDVTSEEVYPCPVEQDPTLLDDWVCCPWGYEPNKPRGYCITESNCIDARCWVECPSHYIECLDRDGVCPSP